MKTDLQKNQDRNLSIRKATMDDAKLIWKWANDPDVRSAAFSPEKILWDAHLSWFESKLNDESCQIYIGLDENNLPFGQVRFDKVKDGESEIDINIDKNMRGEGLGNLLLEIAVEEIFRLEENKKVHAFVKTNNIGSIRAFEKANFRKLGIEEIKGNKVVHFIRLRDE